MSDIGSSGVLYRQTILTDGVVEDTDLDLKTWIEEEHTIVMLKEADRLNVQLRIVDLKHDWLDLYDDEALSARYTSGEFDLTLGRPYPGCRWRLYSECPYVSNDSEGKVNV